MKEKIKELKLALDEEKEITEQIKIKKAVFEKENEELFEKKDSISSTIGFLKNEITEQSLIDYQLDKIKKRYGGIGIQEKKTLLYSPKEALEWATAHNLCIIPSRLDIKAFEQIAKSQKLDFVIIDDIPQVTFPKNIIL